MGRQFSCTGSSYGSGGGVVFVPNSGYSVSAPNGYGEGQLITIHGSFNPVGPQLLYYNNCSAEAPGNQVVHGPTFVASSSLVTATANGNGFPYCEANVNLPYGQGWIVSNDSRVGTVSTGGGWGGMKLTLTSLVKELFIGGTFVFPTTCNYTPLISAGGPQLKIMWQYPLDGISDTDIYSKICNREISLGYVLDNDTVPGWDGTELGTDTEWAWAAGPVLKSTAVKHYRWTQINAAAGVGTGNVMWACVFDGTQQSVNAYDNNQIMAASGATYNGYQLVTEPGFVQYTGATNPNWSKDNNAYILENEMIVATSSSGSSGAAARVDIGDGGTYSTCAHTAYCPVEDPTLWTATNVTARMRYGPFYGGINNLVGKTLYLTDANNNTEPVGQWVDI